ncbi:MAG: AtzE family amidohydrolase [Pseudomonadota bacterium]
MTSAAERVEAALARIEGRNGEVNAFTDVLADRARRTAAALDAGAPTRPLTGVPFAVKNLFDVAGIPTRAGSKIWERRPPAARDAFAIRRLEAAGAVLVGTLNMDEFASGFTTENTHCGPTRNPHDLSRMAGGSSGGSGAAVAAGMVPLTLGSDTNGSIRVPAAACGVWGLKPTYGRLSRAGAALFAESLDHIGPLAADLDILEAAYATMQGADPEDPVQASAPSIDPAPERIRVRLAAGPHFERCDDEGRARTAEAGVALDALAPIELPGVEQGWAASLVVTLIEGSSAHIADLRADPLGFDPMTRDRFLAGALVPAEAYLSAQRARRLWRERCLASLAETDVLVTPGAPFAAPPIGCDSVEIAGETMNPRGAFGLFTQPFSAIGLPALTVPLHGLGLPRAVQLVAKPWREDLLFAAAHRLVDVGLAEARIANEEAWP